MHASVKICHHDAWVISLESLLVEPCVLAPKGHLQPQHAGFVCRQGCMVFHTLLSSARSQGEFSCWARPLRPPM